MSNPVVHFEIMTPRPDRVRKFYAEVFGWQMTPVQDFYTLIGTKRPGDATGIDGGIGESQDGSNDIVMYIEVDDTDAFLKKVNEKGGKTITPTTVVPGMVTFATFKDLDGNTVGLVKREPPAR